jgi:hypothetical protein
MPDPGYWEVQEPATFDPATYAIGVAERWSALVAEDIILNPRLLELGRRAGAASEPGGRDTGGEAASAVRTASRGHRRDGQRSRESRDPIRGSHRKGRWRPGRGKGPDLEEER